MRMIPMGMGQLYEVTAPSGRIVSITPEEEEEIVKEAINKRIQYRMLRKMEIEKAAINATGNAVGFAIGGLLVAWILGKAVKK